MDPLFDLLIYHIGSGQAFFLGMLLLLAGMLLSLVASNPWLALIRNLLVFAGWIWVAISACPLPLWLYGVVGTLSLVWLTCEWFGKSLRRRTILVARVSCLVGYLLALAWELPYHLAPALAPLEEPTLFLLGDSVSAGMGAEKAPTWPQLLKRDHGWNVHDFSQMGATARSACKQADLLGDRTGLILVEIGGNDVLGSTTAANFHTHLDQLLTRLAAPGRTLVMLELPLPPFANAFGVSQRTLARQHGVLLIPKQVFISVLTTPGATLDGVHLTPAGHELMAERLAIVLSAALKRRT